MSDFVFTPTKEQTESSNIYNFIRKNGLSSLDDLSKKAKNNPEWFWETIEKDIGIVWTKKYAGSIEK